MDMIHRYTAEAGVRSLERQIAAIMRKAATQIVKNDVKSVVVNRRNLKSFLGLPKKTEADILKVNTVGVVTGLAWTSVGGQTLAVEVTAMEGTGKLELTGQLGDVMKESAKAGFSLVRSLSDEYDIAPDINEKSRYPYTSARRRYSERRSFRGRDDGDCDGIRPDQDSGAV